MGADFLGVAVLVEAGDEVEAVGLSAGEVGLEGVESCELFAAAHRPHWPFALEFHVVNSRRRLRQFSNPETLVFKGFGYPQAPITVDNFVNVALGKMFPEQMSACRTGGVPVSQSSRRLPRDLHSLLGFR